MKSASYWINTLGLKKHPEGGYYRETYRSDAIIDTCCLGNSYEGSRAVSTAIFFLLVGKDFSALHRIKSDEIWHFYLGTSMALHIFCADEEYEKIILGTRPEKGESFQAIVRAGAWFGATLNDPSAYSLVGCTVAPGFDFRDFEMGRRDELIRLYPKYKTVIEMLTH
jgi:predicted cupin superfamily sugar epimerase